MLTVHCPCMLTVHCPCMLTVHCPGMLTVHCPSMLTVHCPGMPTSPPSSALSPFWGNSCPGRHRCYLVPQCQSPDFKKSNRSNQKNLERLYNRVVVWFVGRNAGLDKDQDMIKIKIWSRSRYVIKTKILPKLICHQNKNVTKIELSSKLKCH